MYLLPSSLCPHAGAGRAQPRILRAVERGPCSWLPAAAVVSRTTSARVWNPRSWRYPVTYGPSESVGNTRRQKRETEEEGCWPLSRGQSRNAEGRKGETLEVRQEVT